jgi:hypothetical protein
MKKILTLVLVTACLVLVGCDDSKPTQWDVIKDADWEIWAEGKLTGITKAPDPRCGDDDNECSNHPFIDHYVFNNEKTVCIRLMRNPGLMSIGQTGTLYKYTYYSNSKDVHAWFQWIQDRSVPVSKPDNKTNISAKKISIPTNKDNYLRIQIDKEDSEWNLTSSGNPERYTPVLIKFKNDTLSLGYINSINEWKLSINQREDEGGETITKSQIIFWKSVDIR